MNIVAVKRRSQMCKSFPSLSAVCAVFVAATAMPAGADTTYLASSAETLYRVAEDGTVESWDFPGIYLRGMHRVLPTGEILVLGDAGGPAAPATMYLLDNPVSGAPALYAYAELSQQYGSLTKIGDLFYAFSAGSLFTLDLTDPADPVETYIGATGVLGTAGAAYDPASDTLYMLSFKYEDDALYTVDRNTGAATWVGPLGIDADDLGGEWFGGQLFAAAQNGSSGYFEIGTVDVATGWYSPLMTVASGVDFVATGLTVIPEPTSFGLLLLGSLSLLRRRRC
jgi:hypothetical protein